MPFSMPRQTWCKDFFLRETRDPNFRNLHWKSLQKYEERTAEYFMYFNSVVVISFATVGLCLQ